MPKPPIDPDSFDKINFVIDSWTTGCDAPWYIYIETMKPAALEAFIVLISFGWADVIRGALRPKGLGRRSKKRIGKWNTKIPMFPEVGNTIGKMLPFAEQIEDFTKWGTPTKFLWRLDNVMQMGLFWWLVADVAEDFMFNWTSLLYESYWCLPDPPGKFSWRNTTMASNPGGWKLGRYFHKDYDTGPPSWMITSGVTGPNGATVAATKKFAKLGSYDPPGSCVVEIRRTGSAEVFASTTSTTPDPDGTFNIPVSASLGPNTGFQVWHAHDAPWAFVGDGVVIGVGNRGS